MTTAEAIEYYNANMNAPHGAMFCKVVGRYQEGFLRDKVTDDLDVAFAKAVDTARRLMDAIKVKA
jgi:hypothetical protein